LIVLSNNDGCAIAPTNVAKALGIKMGEPWHLLAKSPRSPGPWSGDPRIKGSSET
jgi:DNA polymerase V